MTIGSRDFCFGVSAVTEIFFSENDRTNVRDRKAEK